MYRLFHKALIPVLPDDYLIYQLYDCVNIAEALQATGSTGSAITQKILTYVIDEFYTYFLLVRDEAIRRRLAVDIDEIEQDFMFALTDYTQRNTFTVVDYRLLYIHWMSTRYLQQNLLLLEELYDNDVISLKDWFKVVNEVRNMSVLCNETFENLFT